MFMTAHPFSPSYALLSAISPYLSAPIEKGSHMNVSLLTGEQARPVLFFVLWPPFTKEQTLGHA
jgi:hypothetical protein